MPLPWKLFNGEGEGGKVAAPMRILYNFVLGIFLRFIIQSFYQVCTW